MRAFVTEMRPQWYNLEDVPYDTMWSDDRMWFPWYLRGKPFKAFFLYEGHDKILRYTFEQTDGRGIELNWDCVKIWFYYR